MSTLQENKILQDSKPAKFCQQNHMNILTSSQNNQSFYSIADFFVPFTTLSEQNVSLQEEKSNVSFGENTRFKLAKYASSTFRWFLHFRYPKTTSSSSFKFFGVRLFHVELCLIVPAFRFSFSLSFSSFHVCQHALLL